MIGRNISFNSKNGAVRQPSGRKGLQHVILAPDHISTIEKEGARVVDVQFGQVSFFNVLGLSREGRGAETSRRPCP